MRALRSSGSGDARGALELTRAATYHPRPLRLGMQHR
jgi:hypothetical protein